MKIPQGCFENGQVTRDFMETYEPNLVLRIDYVVISLHDVCIIKLFGINVPSCRIL